MKSIEQPDDATLLDATRAMFPHDAMRDDDTPLSHAANAAWRRMRSDERDAILDYTSMMYRRVTPYLNEHRHDDARMNAYVSTLHNALGKCETPQDIIVYRAEYGQSNEHRIFLDAVRNRSDIVRKADFSSTTTRPDATLIPSLRTRRDTDMAEYVIRVPQGTKGMFVSEYSYFPDEYEFLLDRGLAYRVVGIARRPTKPLIIALEIAPQ